MKYMFIICLAGEHTEGVGMGYGLRSFLRCFKCGVCRGECSTFSVTFVYNSCYQFRGRSWEMGVCTHPPPPPLDSKNISIFLLEENYQMNLIIWAVHEVCEGPSPSGACIPRQHSLPPVNILTPPLN